MLVLLLCDLQADLRRAIAPQIGELAFAKTSDLPNELLAAHE
jgi:hypothetical protein